MIEMPEAYTISSQMNTALARKTIRGFARGSLVHKFLWLNRPDEEYQALLAGKTITGASSYGRSMYIYVGGENMLWIGEIGGRLLYIQPGQVLPGKYHLRLDFEDASALILIMQMWGFFKLLDKTQFAERPYDEVGIPPLSADFTFECFNQMLERYVDKTRKGIKGFLVTSVHTNGMGNAYAQDVLFRAGLHPGRKIPGMNVDERRKLYLAIQDVMQQAISLGGREDERDLYDQPGRYQRLMDSSMVGQPCPNCGLAVQKIQYLGGACYFCSTCQPL